MNKKSFLTLLTLMCIVVVFMPILIFYSNFETQKGFAEFKIFDAASNTPIQNASIIIMDKEKVFLSDVSGKAVVQIESKPKPPKEFIGYTAMVAADGYMPTILYNVKVYAAKDTQGAMQYTVSLKKPEASNNAFYDSEFLPTSTDQMAQIIDHYKNLIIPHQ